jgi:hypothetical protein
VDGIKTWSATASTSDKFNKSNSQAGTFAASGAGTATFTITFGVHT